MIVVAVVFWLSAALLLYTQVGYGLLLSVLSRLRGTELRGVADGQGAAESPAGQASLPRVSVIVAAYQEQDVIADRVANLREQDYPAELVEIIVACDGSPDETAERARAAGADLVLELPRGGKVVAQDEAIRHASGELLAFSDANAE